MATADIVEQSMEKHTLPAAKRLTTLLAPANLEKRGEKLDREKTESSTGTGAPAMSNSNSSQRGLAGLMLMKRKVSKWKKGGAGAGSTMGSSIRSGPKMALENTYRLSPEGDQVFSEEKVKKVIGDSLKLFMVKQSAYNPTKSTQVARYITDDIKTRLKQLPFKRYKYVVHAMIGQEREQGMNYASRCIWDTNTDNMVNVTYKHKDIFVVITVFATYFE